jgi:hypothetical protein
MGLMATNVYKYTILSMDYPVAVRAEVRCIPVKVWSLYIVDHEI